MATKIVIEVVGGVVQEVYCDDPAVAVVLVDWDTEECEPDEGTVLVEDGLGYENLARAVTFPTTPLQQLPVETRAAVEARIGHQG